MYIFCGLTPAGKTSNRWGRPEAKFILEENQGLEMYFKKMHNVQRRHQSPFEVHCEYFDKMPLMFMQFYPGLV